jgi:hypothetical protein
MTDGLIVGGIVGVLGFLLVRSRLRKHRPACGPVMAGCADH